MLQNDSGLPAEANSLRIWQPYSPSGAFGLAWPLPLVFGIVAAWLIGGVYALLVVFSPCIGVFNVIVAVIAGGLVGLAVGSGVRIAKVRSPVFAALLGGVAGLALVGFAWLGFVSTLLARSGQISAPAVWFEAIRYPAETWSFITGPLLENGWFNVKGFVPTGIVLIVAWIVEAGCLLVGCIVIPWQAASKPFSERHECWHQSVVHSGGFSLPNRQPRSEQPMQSQDLERLELGGTPQAHLELTIHYLPGKREDLLVSVHSVMQEPQDDAANRKAKKAKFKRVQVLAPHYVSESTIARFDALVREAAASNAGVVDFNALTSQSSIPPA